MTGNKRTLNDAGLEGFGSPAAVMQHLRQGQHYGVAIDDTGAPGSIEHALVPGDRHTWAAVIVRPDCASALLDGLGALIEEVRSRFGAKELHFVDIVGGRREFRDVPWEERLGLVGEMGRLIGQNSVAAMVQSMRPHEAAEWRAALPSIPETLRPFDPKSPRDFSLLILLLRMRRRLQLMNQLVPGNALAFIDEGWKKKNLLMQFSRGVFPHFAGGALVSASSEAVSLLQLADFVAFAITRLQIICGRTQINKRDRQLLYTLNGLISRVEGMRTGGRILIDNETGEAKVMHADITDDRRPVLGMSREQMARLFEKEIPVGNEGIGSEE